MPRRQPTSVALGAPPAAEVSGDSLRPEGMDSHQPHPNGNHHADVSAGDHSTWHPQFHPSCSSTVPADPAKDTSGSRHPFHHMSSAPLQGWTSQPVWWATSATGENEHVPRAITCKQGHWGFLAQWAGAKCRTCSAPKWCPVCQGHKRGWNALHNHSLCPTTSSQGQCANAGAWGEGGGGMGSPSLWDGHTSLSAQDQQGTPVPPTTPDQWCALSFHSRDVGHSQDKAVEDRGSVQVPPTTSASGTPVLQADTKHHCHSSEQGVHTPGQDEGELAYIDDIPKECPHKKQKDGRLAGRALKEPQREAFSKELDVVKVARQAYQKAHRANSNRKGCTTYPPCSDKWPPPLTSWALISMRYRRPGLARKNTELPAELLRPPQRSFTSL